MNQNSLFVPADNKLEAVARISALTNSGPEELGPGSKERKSVLVNLAIGLDLHIDTSRSKQEVGKGIAEALGGTWTSKCESVGQTITLHGLNLLLELASDRLSWSPGLSSDVSLKSVVSEAERIVELIESAVPLRWDGRQCVREMKDAESTNWRQTEWPGWYLEFCSLPVLVNNLGGGPVKYLNTKFDYSLNRVWDLKTHSVKRTRNGWSEGSAQLNDQEAMQLAAADKGLGLVVLSGEPDFSDGQFADWHIAQRGKTGEARRPLKCAFTPLRVDVFFMEDRAALDRAVVNGQLVEFKQGRQPSGEARRPKYSLSVAKAKGSDLQIFERSLASGAA